MTDRWLLRFACVPPLGLAAYAIASHVMLLAGGALPIWLFPVAFLVGGLPALRFAPRASSRAVDPAAKFWKAVPWIGALFLLAAIATVTWGSVATLDREWDGMVSWGPRALWLAPPADLAQPWFRDPAVYAHSSTYPLLQPLCLGACQALLGALPGRLFFPFLFVAFLLLLGAVAREAGLSRGAAWLTVLGFGTTPMWYSTGSGAIDSGYAELFLAYALAVAATGLITGRPLLIASGAVLLPLLKPEGLPYGVLLALATLVLSPGRRQHGAATLGLAGAAALWLPLQARLMGQPPGALSWLLPLLLLALLLPLRELQLRVRWRVRTWALVGFWLALVAGAQLLALSDPGAAGKVQSPLLGEFEGALLEVPGRLAELPTVLAGYAEGFLFVRKFGLLFPMLLFLLCFRPSWCSGMPHRATTAFFLGGIGLACAAIFLGSSDDWDHLFASRFDRLLLHWVGVGWLLLGPWLSELWTMSERLGSGPPGPASA